MLMGIVALFISLVFFSYGLYDLIVKTMATANESWAMVILGGFTNICRALVPFMILGMLIYEIRSLVDLIRRVRLADKE